MNTRALLSLLLILACLVFPGCATTSTTSTLAPVVTQIAIGRLTQPLIEKNPRLADHLLELSAALDALESGEVHEITEVAVRLFVAKQTASWHLLPAEEELLVQGLLAARDAFLSQTGAGQVLTSDPRIKVWVDAIQRGIESGVAAHRLGR
jgi:hypothetical protein